MMNAERRGALLNCHRGTICVHCAADLERRFFALESKSMALVRDARRRSVRHAREFRLEVPSGFKRVLGPGSRRGPDDKSGGFLAGSALGHVSLVDE